VSLEKSFEIYEQAQQEYKPYAVCLMISGGTDSMTAAEVTRALDIIHHWTKPQCLDFLEDCSIKRNPVTETLCRSGECMCGTMQSDEDRKEASFFYPEWGKWLNDLEARVMRKFLWGWGEDAPDWWKREQRGQLPMFPDFQPACQSCIAKGKTL